jgi:hypothetical protein
MVRRKAGVEPPGLLKAKLLPELQRLRIAPARAINQADLPVSDSWAHKNSRPSVVVTP